MLPVVVESAELLMWPSSEVMSAGMARRNGPPVLGALVAAAGLSVGLMAALVEDAGGAAWLVDVAVTAWLFDVAVGAGGAHAETARTPAPAASSRSAERRVARA